MDVRELKFDSESFDVAIDKGTMDAMMTAKADVWVRMIGFDFRFEKFLNDARRILRKRSWIIVHVKSVKFYGTFRTSHRSRLVCIGRILSIRNITLLHDMIFGYVGR